MMRAVLLGGIGGCALMGAAFAAEEIIDMGDVKKDGGYYTYYGKPKPGVDTYVKFNSIESDNISIDQAFSVSNSTVNVQIGKISVIGDASVYTDDGDIVIGDVYAGHFAAGTQNGDFTVNGTIKVTGNTSNIAVAGTGDIILNGADITNVAIGHNETATGSILISGNTTLTNVYFSSDKVEVAAGSALTLNDIAFNTREYTDNVPQAPVTDLILGDNVTVTLIGDQPLAVDSLAVGEGVSLIVELSNDVYDNLGDGPINLFTVNGEYEGKSELEVTLRTADGQVKKGTASVKIASSIPEPATATLSLLALMGLAARRRRK